MEVKNWEKALLPFHQAVNELVVKFNGMKRNFTTLEMAPPIEQVEGRVKRISSIIEKANRRNIPVDKSLDILEDIAGIRIICRFVDDIETVVELIHKRKDIDMKILLEEDYVKNSKSSGYRSYHMTINYPIVFNGQVKDIKVEVQIRTMAMNFWATIEHSLKYKFDGKIPDNLQERLKICAEAAYNLDLEMDKIKDEIKESQKYINEKESIVNKIIENIHMVYIKIGAEQMNEYNYQFMKLYQEGNMSKLYEFNLELEKLLGLS